MSDPFIRALLQSALLTAILIFVQASFGPDTSLSDPMFWWMSLVVWPAFFVGFWFFHRFLPFWNARHPLFGPLYGLLIILAYVAYLWGFYLKYPIWGESSLVRLYPWLLILAGLATMVMFAPSILRLSHLMSGRVGLRFIMGLLILVLLSYPYWNQRQVSISRPSLFLSLGEQEQAVLLEGLGLKVWASDDQIPCTASDLRQWRIAMLFVPFYWFLTSPFTKQELCFTVRSLSLEAWNELRWDSRVVLVWNEPDWFLLPELIPNFRQVYLQSGPEHSPLWYLDYEGDRDDSTESPFF